MAADFDFTGKRIVMTGATDGIGLAAARVFAAGGAELTLVARDPGKVSATAAHLSSISPQRTAVQSVLADLSLQSEVRRASAEIAARHAQIDVLINNAGAMFNRRIITADGIELTWALNHLAPFLMTNLLLDRLKAAPAARVVTTASDAHWRGGAIPFDDINAERGYRGFTRYGQSKLANILFTRALGQRLLGTTVSASCYHPGLVATNFNRNNGPLMNLVMQAAKLVARTPQKGAETMVWLAGALEARSVNGGYFFDEHIGRSSVAAHDDEAATRLWRLSEQQVAASALPPASRAIPD
jgi:NAD(P)-dependent dehydrogenase (short-subunit alcohol dehydrogenase family)